MMQAPQLLSRSPHTWLRLSIVRTCSQQQYFSVSENLYFILTAIHKQEKTCPVLFFFFSLLLLLSQTLKQNIGPNCAPILPL